MTGSIMEIILESWRLLGQMAPYLLFGFLVAGILSVYVSPEWVERNLGGGGILPVFKASLFGVPLPLCSCGVIPVSASLRRHGASRAATTAFLLSTPQTGVDSILVTYALLGPVFAVFRPIAALISGVIGGIIVQVSGDSSSLASPGKPPEAPCEDSCCSGENERGAVSRALSYGFKALPADIGPALLIGILIAGIIAALVPQDALHAYIGGGILSILIMMVAGVPVYVCATASVPIAAGFMHAGASPGAALAFLIAGPATNAVAFATVCKVLGRRTALLYLATVAASAVCWGVVLDLLMPAMETVLPELCSHAHAKDGWFPHVSAVALLGVLAFSRVRASMSSTSAPESIDSGGELRIKLLVSGMTCSHCAESVRRGVAECAGVHAVEVDRKQGRVVVTGQGIDVAQLVSTVVELGFTADVWEPETLEDS